MSNIVGGNPTPPETIFLGFACVVIVTQETASKILQAPKGLVVMEGGREIILFHPVFIKIATGQLKCLFCVALQIEMKAL